MLKGVSKFLHPIRKETIASTKKSLGNVWTCLVKMCTLRHFLCPTLVHWTRSQRHYVFWALGWVYVQALGMNLKDKHRLDSDWMAKDKSMLMWHKNLLVSRKVRQTGSVRRRVQGAPHIHNKYQWVMGTFMTLKLSSTMGICSKWCCGNGDRRLPKTRVSGDPIFVCGWRRPPQHQPIGG